MNILTAEEFLSFFIDGTGLEISDYEKYKEQGLIQPSFYNNNTCWSLTTKGKELLNQNLIRN